MRPFLLILFLPLFFLLDSCKTTQSSTNAEHTVIEAAEEVRLSPNRKSFTYMKSGQEFKTKRALKGTLSPELTDSLFSLAQEENLPASKVLLIYYYPAKTLSNSTGSCNSSCTKNKYKQVDRRINKLEGTAVSYLKRPGADLGKYAEISNWKDDTYYLIERNFVPHPQLGNSFIVLSKNGNYEAYLGEYPQSYVLETFSRVYKKN